MKRDWLSWPLAPFLLAIYPVLHLYSINTGHVREATLCAPLMMAFWIAAALMAAAFAWSRRLDRAAVTVSAFLFLSFFLTSLVDATFPDAQDSIFCPAINAALVLLTLEATVGVERYLQHRHDCKSLLSTINIGVFFLLSIPLIQISRYQAHHIREELSPAPLPRAALSASIQPDVYYIILDGYARADVLKNDLQYDNGPFIGFLKQHGFYVADQSRSNYAYTYLSLASSLNMNYLQGLNQNPVQQTDCLKRIQESRVMGLFKEKGYRIVHFASGWSVTDYNPQADITIKTHDINEFQSLLIRDSLLRVILAREWMSANKGRVLAVFDGLKKMPQNASSSFIFVHLLCPHPPYIFDRQGKTPPQVLYRQRPPGSRDWYPKERYVDQVDYLNGRIEEVITAILAHSKKPPLIILQGDHGAACDGTSAHPSALQIHERLGILNAYYVPEALRAKLYPSISPVNSFRLITNFLFDGHLPLLPDRNYYSGPMDATPYQFQDVTKTN